MKLIKIIFILFLFSVCGDNSKKRKDQAQVRNYVFIQALVNSSRSETCTALALAQSFDIKSIQIYYRQSLVFTQPIGANGSFINVGECSHSGSQWVNFTDNSYIKSLYLTVQSRPQTAKLILKDGKEEYYSNPSSVDFSNFTDFTAGDYRFVPVR